MEKYGKTLNGYEGLYQVSNLGRIKALERRKNCNRGYGIIKEHIMKQTNKNSNYYRVPLTDNNHTKKYFSVHRLVAKTFIENPNNYKDVNHIDGDKTNNCEDNLEWCTRSYNIRHAFDTGLNPSKKKIIEYVSDLEKRIEVLEQEIAQMEYKVGE